MASDEPLGDFTKLTQEQITELWEKFYPRLRASISERVRKMQRPVASQSEIALSAFHSLVQRAQDGQFPDLNDETGFWKLLRTFALRKANGIQKKLWASKRGGSQPTVGQSDTEGDDSRAQRGIASAASQQPANELEVADLLTSLLEDLPSDRYRDVILLKLQGAETQTIAECLSTTPRTVQRLLKNIKEEWESELKV